MTIRFVALGVVVAGVLSWARVAGADVPSSDATSRHSRLFAGTDFGFILPGAAWGDGKRVAGEGGNLTFGYHAGYSHALSQRFGVLGLTRFGIWRTALAEARDEERFRIDLALGPELRVGDRTGGWRLSAPLGVTIAQSQAGTTGRAVRDSYGPGRGLNFGLVGGFDISPPRSSGGLYVDFSWITHVTWIDRTARLTSSDSVIHESYSYVDHLMLCTVGGLIRL